MSRFSSGPSASHRPTARRVGVAAVVVTLGILTLIAVPKYERTKNKAEWDVEVTGDWGLPPPAVQLPEWDSAVIDTLLVVVANESCPVLPDVPRREFVAAFVKYMGIVVTDSADSGDAELAVNMTCTPVGGRYRFELSFRPCYAGDQVTGRLSLTSHRSEPRHVFEQSLSSGTSLPDKLRESDCLRDPARYSWDHSTSLSEARDQIVAALCEIWGPEPFARLIQDRWRPGRRVQDVLARATLGALARMGPEARAAVPTLMTLLEQSEFAVQDLVHALTAITGEQHETRDEWLQWWNGQQEQMVID